MADLLAANSKGSTIFTLVTAERGDGLAFCIDLAKGTIVPNHPRSGRGADRQPGADDGLSNDAYDEVFAAQRRTWRTPTSSSPSAAAVTHPMC